MSGEQGDIEDVGWRLDVDRDADELHIEHVESGDAYVFDADGNLRVSGEGNVGGELRELRATLAAALADGHEQVGGGSRSATGCTIECDPTTGAVSIESDSKISLAAPTIELSARGNLSVDADGVLTLEGALVKLN